HRNAQRDNRVPAPEVEPRDGYGDRRQNHQRSKYDEVDRSRNDVFRHRNLLVVEVCSQQVEQWKKKDPHYIDKVPIETRYFYRRIVFRCKAASFGHHKNHGHDSEPDNHMKRVNSSHREIEEVKHLDIARFSVAVPGKRKPGDQMVDVLLMVLNSFHPKHTDTNDIP